MSSAAVNVFAATSSKIMSNESYQIMENYDKIVRRAIETGMPIEKAVEKADHMYDMDEPAHGKYPFSLYIPRIRKDVTEQFVHDQLAFLGAIKRIDFVRNKNFVTKTVDEQYKRVFVHFHDGARNCENASRVFDAIEATGQYAFTPNTLDQVWYLQYADEPIEDTEFNIHQLAHVYEIIDDKVIDAEQKMFQQDALIEQLQDKNDALEEQVRELQKSMISMQLLVDSMINRCGGAAAPLTSVSMDEAEEKCRDAFNQSSRR